MFVGVSVCRPNGIIAAGHDWRSVKTPAEFVGTYTWEWFIQHEQVKTIFARALMGDPLSPVVVDLDVARVGKHLSAIVYYLPTGEPALPVLGTFTAFPSVVQNLTPRERQVAKLLPMFSAKEIAARLEISTSTVETLKQRIALRLGQKGPRLIATLAELRDVL